MHEIHLKLKPDWTFETTNSDDLCLVQDNLSVGEIYKAKPRKPRSLTSLGKYWLLMSAVTFFRDGSENYWHEQFKKMYFGFHEIVDFMTGEKRTIAAKSISFDGDIDEVEFKKYLSFCFEKLAEFGLDGEKLIMEYKSQRR